MQVLFGILLSVYIPNLDPYPGYNTVQLESNDDVVYEALPEGDNVCPERHASIISS